MLPSMRRPWYATPLVCDAPGMRSLVPSRTYLQRARESAKKTPRHSAGSMNTTERHTKPSKLAWKFSESIQ